MYSVLLIDVDPIRAFDLYIKLEDDGFNVLGPVTSTSEGFRWLQDEGPEGIIIHAETAQQFFPELYAAAMESDIPVIFLDAESKPLKSRRGNSFIFNSGDPLHALKSYLTSQAVSSLDNNYMIPNRYLDTKINTQGS